MARTDIDMAHFKQKLEEELRTLTKELQAVGVINPSNPNDWEAKQGEWGVGEADRNEAADRIEAFEENSAILKELEIRYNNVKHALERVEKGTYGTCAVDEAPIEVERLEANPAALTCKTHIEQEEEFSRRA